jgi:hypothetical protein
MEYSEPKAEIISFHRRRGRPKNNRPLHDTGTPETIMKRLLGITTEALDLCLERKIISERQHWCGIHLRWLYTLRHGVPNVKTMDISNSSNQIKNDDPAWREEREKEYNEALNLLTKSGNSLLLLNLCVYNHRPQFLDFTTAEMQRNFASIADNIARLRNGLDILSNLWKRS